MNTASVTPRVAQMPQKTHPRLRADLRLSEIAETIARLLYSAVLINRDRPEVERDAVTFRDLPVLEQTHFRSLAQQVVMSIDPLAVSRAESRATDWIVQRLAEAYADHFTDFPNMLVVDACRGMVDEMPHQLERAWQEREVVR